MADEPEPKNDPTPAPKGGDDKTFTQAEVDALIDKRFARERKNQPTPEQVSEWKAKAEAADKAGESDKGEAQKLADQLAKMQTDLDDERRQRRIIEVAADKGLTPARVKRLTGTTREELDTSADELLEDFPIPAKSDGEDGDKKEPVKRPVESLKPGASPPAELADVKPGAARLRAAYEDSDK